MIIQDGDLKLLRRLLQVHSGLAQEYAEADPDEVDVDRMYNRLRDLESMITAEVSALFEEFDNE